MAIADFPEIRRLQSSRRPITMQGMKIPEESTYTCGIHAIEYKGFRAGCPLCEAERELKQLRKAVGEATGKMRLMHDENQKLKLQVDISYAIREAAEILDDADMEFFKTVLYEWRDTKSVAIKTTHGGSKVSGGRRGAANGFIVMPRQGDPYGHVCTSMGGLAIAEYFLEAQNSVGPAKAMELLTRGMALHLPGAVQ